MNYIVDLVNNELVIAGFLGWLIAQIAKVIIHMIITKQFIWERLIGNGGMPSSHSSMVCAVTVCTLMIYGTGSFEFLITLLLAIIVMHDASNVRYETGKQAKLINDMMKLFSDMNSDMPPYQKLREFVGHSPIQVTIGAILGIAIGVIVHTL